MVYVVGLPAPAFPAFGPHVGWPNTDIGSTTCSTPLVPKILPVVDSGMNDRVCCFPVFEMLSVGNQVSNYRKNKETTVKQHKIEILDLWHT